MTKPYFKLSLALPLACMLSSCIDDKYDLSDVDWNIGTTADITLPQSSTGDILLSNIFDITEDGIVQVVNGDFYLVEDGHANVPSIEMSPVTFRSPRFTNMDMHVDVDQTLPSSEARAAVSAHGVDLSGLQHISYTYTIEDDDKAYYQLDDDAMASVPKDIISLDEITFVDGTQLNITFKAAFDAEHAFVDRLHMDDLKLHFPKGMYVKSVAMSHWTEMSGEEKYETFPASDIDNENGIITLTTDGHHTLLGENHEVRIIIDVEKATTGKGGFAFANNIAQLKGKFEVSGSFRIESSEFNLEALTVEQVNAVIASGTYSAISPKRLDVIGNAFFDGDIHVASFTGKVQTSVHSIAPIALNDLPDFLNEPDVVLDLANPAIYVEVNNPLPAQVSTGLSLTSSYTDGTPDVSRATDQILLPANTRSVVRIAENPEGSVLPAKYEGLPVIDAPVADLSALLTHLPEAIEVKVSDILMEAQAMPLPEKGITAYDVTVDYMFYTPLQLGENTRLVYRGEEDGLAEDLEDVNKMNTKAIEIAAVVESTFPMNLLLSLDAQDSNGNSLVGDIVSVNDIAIEACNGGEAASHQDILLTITPLQGHTVRELLERLDRFVYRAVAEAPGDAQLKDDAYLKLTNIRITLKGGISYDAN